MTHRGNGVLAAPRVRRCRLADYEPYAEPGLLEDIESLGRRVAGLRVLHLSNRDAGADPAPAGLRSLLALERDVGLESEWLVPWADADARHAADVGDWWPRPSEAQWSSWVSFNFRAARDIEGSWDVAVVHGASLAGVAAIASDRAGRWLWQVDDAVDPLAPHNARLARGVARRMGRILDLDFDRPFLCHIARFAPWVELDAVIGAYWEAKQANPELQLVVGGAAAGRDARGHKSVGARASEDDDLHVLPRLSSLEIAALRNAASINVRGPAPAGHTVDVRECHWIGRPVLAWPPGNGVARLPLDGYTPHAADAVRVTGLQIAELLMSHDDSRGHAAVRSDHLIVHSLRDTLRTLASVVAAR